MMLESCRTYRNDCRYTKFLPVALYVSSSEFLPAEKPVSFDQSGEVGALGNLNPRLYSLSWTGHGLFHDTG